MSSLNEDPGRGMSIAAPAMSQGPAPVPVGVELCPAPPPEAPPRPDVEFRQVGGGGVIPAREVTTRGPKQSALLERSFEHPLNAADRIEERSRIQAEREAAMYDAIAEDHLNQKMAMERVVARREQEMAGLRQNYADTIQQLGTMKIDNDRLWNNSSTGDKIGAIALGILGGLFAGSESKTKKAIDKRIEDDVKAQMFDYQKGLDIAKAQQTAFGLAMQQFGNEDAAYHAATAAGQQYTAARMSKLAAEWKGTESANRADDMRAQYQTAADQSAANGFKFLQPTATAPQFALSVRGQRAPGLFSQDKAQAAFFEHGIKPSERVDEDVVKGGIQMRVEGAKAAHAREGKVDEGAHKISTQLQQAGVPQARAAAEAALRALNKSEGGKAEAVARWGLGDTASNAVMSEDANAREQAYWTFKNASMKAMMGNVTESEMARAEKQLGSASDPESRRRAIQATLETLAEIEKNAKAGQDPAVQAEFERRRENAKGDKPAAPTGSSKGWGK